MQYVDLRNALAINAGTLTITSGTLTANIAALINSTYAGQPIVLTQASYGAGDGQNNTVVIAGTAAFQNVSAVAVTLRAWIDGSGTAQITLRYALLGTAALPGATWKFSTSFPDLPPVIDWAGTADAPMVIPLDALPLTEAALVVASSAGQDPLRGVPLTAGLNFVGQMQPTGIASHIANLFGVNQALTISGTVNLPSLGQSAPILGAQQNPWEVSNPPPGIVLRAALSPAVQIGNLKLSNGTFLVYSPPSMAWQNRNPDYRAQLAFLLQLQVPSAGLAVNVVAPIDVGARSLSLQCAFATQVLPSWNKLLDLAGTDQLFAQLPQSIQSLAGAVSAIRLNELGLSLSINPGSTPVVSLSQVSLSVELPGVSWQVFDPRFRVENLACQFDIVKPLSQPTFDVTLSGMLLVAGALLKIQAKKSEGFVVRGELATATTLPLNNLFSTYGQGLVPVGNLTVNELRLMVDPQKEYSFLMSLANSSTPWLIDLGPVSLGVSDVVARLDSPVSGPLAASFAGTVQLGEARLNINVDLPGEFAVQGRLERTSLIGLLFNLCGNPLNLPSGFDVVLENASVLVKKRGASLVFQLAAQIDGFGLFALEVRNADLGWGGAVGISFAGRLSSIPGLATLGVFEDVFQLQKFVLLASSFADPGFNFPDVASFNAPELGGQSLSVPAGGIVAGLNAMAEWRINTGDNRQKLLKQLLGLDPTVRVMLQVPQNPSQQALLYVAYSTKICGHPFDCRFGGRMSPTGIGLFLSGNLRCSIQGNEQVFAVSLNYTENGALLSASMSGAQPIDCGAFKLANLALAIGINWEGIPSLGLAATIATSAFASSVAVFFDSTNPSKSMVAGSLSDLSLKQIVNGLTGGAAPSVVDNVLDLVQLTGTQRVVLPPTLVADLNSGNLAGIATAFAGVGIAIPSAPEQILVVRDDSGQKWYLTDLLHGARHYQIVLSSEGLVASLQTQFYFAPQQTTIGALAPFQPGSYVNAGLSVLGFKGSTTVDISANQGIYAKATLDRIVIGSERFFNVSSVAGNSGPQMSLATFSRPQDPVPEFRSPHLFIDGQLNLLGVSKRVYAHLDPSTGFNFALGGVLAPSVSFNLNGAFRDPLHFAASGSVNANIGSVDLGFLGSVSIDSGVNASFAASFDGHNASAEFEGSLQFAGQTLSIPRFSLDVHTQSLADTAQILAARAITALRGFLSDAFRWAQCVYAGFITGVNAVANVLRDVFHIGDQVAMRILSNVGYSVTEIGNQVTAAYGLAAEQVARSFQQAGVIADEVATWLASTPGRGLTELTGLLRGAGYGAAEASVALCSALDVAESAVSNALYSAGYAATEVLGTLSEVNKALSYAGSLSTWASGNLVGVADALQGRITDVTQSAANLAVAGLKPLGCSINDAGRAIASTLGRNLVLPAISSVYAVSDVAQYARYVMNVPADQLASVFMSGMSLSSDAARAALVGVGYSTAQIDNAMSVTYDWASNNLNPSRW